MSRHAARAPEHRRRLAPTLGVNVGAVLSALLVVGVALGTVVVNAEAPAGTPHVLPATGPIHVLPAAAGSAPPGPRGHWVQVLRRLDQRRGDAYATGDPSALAAVYVAGSQVLARDQATLGAYVRHGLTVAGATPRLLALQARRTASGDVRLRVVDRLGPAAARTGRGTVIALPSDQPTAHRIVLTRTAVGWRIATVRRIGSL